MFFIYLITYSLIAVFLSSCAQLPFDNGDGRTGPIDTKAQFSISGNPRTEAYIGFGYQFKPKVTKFNEKDVITFTIENKPTWLALDTTTGELSGFPAKSDRGSYPDIQLSVTNGKDIKYLQPFAIKVTQWKGFGYCSGVNSGGDTLCTPISSNYVIDSQCQSWADMQGLRNPILHIYDKQSTLITNAKAVCSTPPIFGNHCPKGYVKVKQLIQTSTIACMPKFSKDEFISEFNKTLTQDIIDYSNSMKRDALPDFKPIPIQITGPDAKGIYTVVLPPPVSQQNELEKQRRSREFSNALNRSYDCSSLTNNDSFWNKTFCSNWKLPIGVEYFGVDVDVMGYMKVSGESAVSVKIVGNLAATSTELIKLFANTQVYASPSQYDSGGNLANGIIKAAKNGDSRETLEQILNSSPTLQGGVVQVGIEFINAVKNAKREFDQAKAEAEASVSKTLAEIELAKSKFATAEAKLNQSIAAFNEAKAVAETAAANSLQPLTAEKTEYSMQLVVAGRTLWKDSNYAIGQQPLKSRTPFLNKNYEIFHASQQFIVAGFPINVQETVAATLGLGFDVSISNPLQLDAVVKMALQPSIGLDVTGQAGVGIEWASAGVGGTVSLAKTIFEFGLASMAQDFPKLPLVFATINGKLLSGKLFVYGELKGVLADIGQGLADVGTAVTDGLKCVVTLGGSCNKSKPPKVGRAEKALFNWGGLSFPKSAQKCNRPEYRNKEILFCSRPEICYVENCVGSQSKNSSSDDDKAFWEIIKRILEIVREYQKNNPPRPPLPPPIYYPPPSVQTTGATNISTNGVTLKGLVSSKNSTTNTYFDYGSGVVLGKIVPAGTVSPGINSVEMGIHIPLSCGTYFYRIRAINSGGVTSGNIVKFSLPCPPRPSGGGGSGGQTFNPKKLSERCWIWEPCFRW